jgi:hypothetical protein
MGRKPYGTQTNHNPFIAPDSQYRCNVSDCSSIGVWSPMLNGSVWYCRKHAELPEPAPRWEPTPGPHTGEEIAAAKEKVREFIASGKIEFEPPSDAWWQRLITRSRNGEKLLLIQQQMATQAWINAKRPRDWTPPDVEALEERAAIQAEGNLAWPPNACSP